MTDHIEKTKAMIDVMQAYVDGKQIIGRKYCTNGWVEQTWHPSWNWTDIEFKVATTPDTIDWSHVAPEWKYMARDRDGNVYMYNNEPRISVNAWSWHNGEVTPAMTFASYRRGTCDWKDSLVRRPDNA